MIYNLININKSERTPVAVYLEIKPDQLLNPNICRWGKLIYVEVDA